MKPGKTISTVPIGDKACRIYRCPTLLQPVNGGTVEDGIDAHLKVVHGMSRARA